MIEFVKDIEISKAFYCKILKQEIATDFGNNISLKSGLTLWQIPEWHDLYKGFYTRRSTNKAMEIYFETTNIMDVVKQIEKNNISKQHELIEESWGQKTIRIFDPDNNLVEIGEKMEIFIKRMYTEGLSIEEINKKTGVPEKLIWDYIK
jgi:catechol 2,3-dioxygenase-like lactoylglutathione lyase family enzyme